VLGLDGLGSAERFADYSQWEAWQRAQLSSRTLKSADDGRRPRAESAESLAAATRKKLSYQEARELAAMERKIGEAERELHAKRAVLEDPAVTGDRIRLQGACTELDAAQKAVDDLYVRWAELEKRLS